MITKTCFAVLLGLIPFMADAQTAATADKAKAVSRQEVVIKPRFRGNLNEYIVRNVKYPEKARERGVQGKCVVEFMVDERGQIQRISSLQSSGNELLDAEAQRLVAAMPTWRPGTCDQRPVHFFYSLPINFELQ